MIRFLIPPDEKSGFIRNDIFAEGEIIAFSGMRPKSLCLPTALLSFRTQ
ncbi:MAG TPA: hypothetical protein VI757_00830 [Bacteroidia bacterium]|nr:hypothetical protein [Bacteroidia bacterium]